jgi:hypothetical protein
MDNIKKFEDITAGLRRIKDQFGIEALIIVDLADANSIDSMSVHWREFDYIINISKQFAQAFKPTKVLQIAEGKYSKHQPASDWLMQKSIQKLNYDLKQTSPELAISRFLITIEAGLAELEFKKL